MKLLFVENIANVSYNIAKRLRQMGHEVTLISRYNPKAGHLDLASISDEPWVKLFECKSRIKHYTTRNCFFSFEYMIFR